MKPRVVITHWVHPEVVELLNPQCVLVPNPTRESLPREEILRRTKDAQEAKEILPGKNGGLNS